MYIYTSASVFRIQTSIHVYIYVYLYTHIDAYRSFSGSIRQRKRRLAGSFFDSQLLLAPSDVGPANQNKNENLFLPMVAVYVVAFVLVFFLSSSIFGAKCNWMYVLSRLLGEVSPRLPLALLKVCFTIVT